MKSEEDEENEEDEDIEDEIIKDPHIISIDSKAKPATVLYMELTSGEIRTAALSMIRPIRKGLPNRPHVLFDSAPTILVMDCCLFPKWSPRKVGKPKKNLQPPRRKVIKKKLQLTLEKRIKNSTCFVI